MKVHYQSFAEFDSQLIFKKLRNILLFVFICTTSGVISTLFEATFSIKFGIIIFGIAVIFMAKLTPNNKSAPHILITNLLCSLVLIWALWPVYLSFQGLPGPSLNPTRLIYWFLSILWIFWIIASFEYKNLVTQRIKQNQVFVFFFLCYVAWSLLCAVMSQTPMFSLYYMVKLMIGPIIIFTLTLCCINNRKDIDKILLYFVISAVIACAFGILESVKKSNLFIDIVPSLFPQGEDAVDWSEGLKRDKSRDGLYRVMSTFSNPLTFGEYLVLAFPISAYLSFFGKLKLHKFIGIIAIPAILIGVYITHTRSSLISLGIVNILIFIILGISAINQTKNFATSIIGSFTLVFITITLFVALGFLIDIMVGRTAAEAGSSMARVTMLQRGFALIGEQPIIGYGPGRAAFAIGFLPGITVLTIDNFYLSVGIETGIIGLILFLGMFATLIIKAFFVSRRFNTTENAQVLAILFAILSFLVTRTVLSLTENMDKVFLLIALLCGSLQKQNEKTLSQRSEVSYPIHSH